MGCLPDASLCLSVSLFVTSNGIRKIVSSRLLLHGMNECRIDGSGCIQGWDFKSDEAARVMNYWWLELVGFPQNQIHWLSPEWENLRKVLCLRNVSLTMKFNDKWDDGEKLSIKMKGCCTGRDCISGQKRYKIKEHSTSCWRKRASGGSSGGAKLICC